jgi:hypothetical protein
MGKVARAIGVSGGKEELSGTGRRKRVRRAGKKFL